MSETELKQCLFIGGPLDGQRMDTDGRRYIRATEERDPDISLLINGELSAKEYEYIRHDIHRSDGEIVVVYSVDLSGASIIHDLIKGYTAPHERYLPLPIGQSVKQAQLLQALADYALNLLTDSDLDLMTDEDERGEASEVKQEILKALDRRIRNRGPSGI